MPRPRRIGGQVAGGCRSCAVDALSPSTFAEAAAPDCTFIQLTGTPKPAPWKEREFRAVDKVSLEASVDAAARSGSIRHFIYVSVAHPAPIMRAYIKIRCECEAYLAGRFAARTVLRPWHVLGPAIRWPYALKPFCALTAKRESAARRSAQHSCRPRANPSRG